MTSPAGESNGEALRLDFDRRLMLQFRGSVVTPHPGLVACHELDDALGLSTMAGETLADARTSKNGRYATRPLRSSEDWRQRNLKVAIARGKRVPA